MGIGKKLLKKSLFCLMLLGLSVLFTTASYAAVNGKITPSSGTGPKGGTLSVTISIASDAGDVSVYGIDSYINYDPAVFAVPTITKLDSGDWFTISTKANFEANGVNPDKTQYSVGAGGGKTGLTATSNQTNLFRLDFPVKATAPIGNTTISFDTTVNKFKVLNTAWQNITGSVINATVAIGVADPTLSLLDQTSGSASYTNSQTVNVTVGNDSGIDKWLISETQSTKPAASDPKWGPEPTTFSLSAGDGAKTVYIWVKDAAGNINPNAVNKSITLDISAPGNPTLSLSDQTSGSTTVSDSQTVNVSIGNDSGVSTYLISESQSAKPAENAAGWSSKPATFTLSAGNGDKTVYLWVKDAAGNINAGTTIAKIKLETITPKANISIEDPLDHDNTIEFEGKTTDTTLSKKKVRIYNDSASTSLNFTFNKDAAWITQITPGGSTLAPKNTQDFDITVDISKIPNLTPGKYKTTVQINSAADFDGEKSFEVQVTVTPPLPTAPTITNVTWDNNPNQIYSTMNIFGTNFGADPGAGNRSTAVNNIKIDGKMLSEIIGVSGAAGTQVYSWSNSVNPNKISVGLPIKASGATDYITAGSKSVVVTAGSNPSVGYNIDINPVIYSANPNSGSYNTTVTLNGTGFGNVVGNINAYLDGDPLVAVAVTGAEYYTDAGLIKNRITVAVPAASEGAHKIYVTIGGKTASIAFTVTAAPINNPSITKAYNKKFGETDTWVYVTPSGGNWKPGDPVDDSLTLKIEGDKFGTNAADASVAPAGASISVKPFGLQYQPIPAARMYYWANKEIQIGIPDKFATTTVAAGPAHVKVTTADGDSKEQAFDIKANIYSITPTSAMPNDEVTIAGLAFGDNKNNVQVTFNKLPATIVTLANDSIKVIVPQLPVTNTVEVIVTVNGVSTTYSGATKFIISDKSPKINSVSPASPEVGQTISITGSNFGSAKGNSTVWFGSSAGNPTVWNETTIVVAIPSDAPTGEGSVKIVTDNGEVSGSITISNKNIVIDDIDGGCVGSFDPNLAKDSGYYAFGAGITPDEKSINTMGPLSEAAYPTAGAYKGMKIKYSYATGEASGWGGKLANVLDISKAQGISMLVKWDNSANDFTFALKDKNGIQAKALVPKSTLQALNNTYAKISISRSNFTPETSGFDWTKIAEYSVVYTTKASSEGVQYFDSIIAYTQGQVIQSEVAISSIDPSSAPAGTKIKVNGQGFGFSQGQSVLVFENIDTKVSYNAEITKWGDGQIEAKVPSQAIGGIYNVRVLKVSILANTLNALESNNASFKVTAAAPAEGVVGVYPNPFNPLSSDPLMNKATFTYSTAGATNIGIYVYDMTAKLVYKDQVSASPTTWDGKDTWLNYVSNGAYLVRVVNEDNKSLIAKGKVLVIKE